MSSHHFVKEGQEPALLVLDALPDDHLMSLLEWSPLVLVADSAISTVAMWGIRVDAVCVDGVAPIESVAYTAIPQVGPVSIVDCTAGLVPAVLSFLRNHQQRALYVMTAKPEASFQLWEDAGAIQIALLNASMKWSLIAAGRFEKWLPEGAELTVRGAGHLEVWGASHRGERVTAQHSGIVRIQSSASIWVGEPIQ